MRKQAAEITPPTDPVERERWLDGLAPLKEFAALRGVSVDTVKREHARGKVKLKRVSERRWGGRRRDALMYD